jgi:Na+-transporting NADH:ubiquinone oxidoreductase subunit B/electron transport complex protein RnfD
MMSSSGQSDGQQASQSALFRGLRDFAISDADRANAPGLPGARDVQRYLIAAAFAAVPCLAAMTYYFGSSVGGMIAVAAIAAAAVETLFAVIRKRPVGGGGLVFAVLFVLVVPPGIPLWMVAAGSAFGILFGKEVFGGAGHHIFCPVLVGKAFLVFSYPRVVKGSHFGSMLEFGEPNAWMICVGLTLLGAVAMIVARRSNWHIFAAIIGTGLGLGWLMRALERMPFDSPFHMTAADGFLFGACFLACNPACSPRTRTGKWLYGIIIALAAVLIRCYSTQTEAMMSAILLGNVAAPALDALTTREREGDE